MAIDNHDDTEMDIAVVEEKRILDKSHEDDYTGAFDELIFNSESAIYSIISICTALIILLASGIGIIHFWNDTEIGIIGGPPSALLVWENEYR